MTITLQVAQAFDTYGVGDQIPLPDVAALALLKAFPGRYQFSSSSPGPSPGSPIVVPAQPATFIPVVGVPDPVLAATYGLALDLTSVPNTLYKWTGTAWAVILQAGSGGGVSSAAGSVPSSAALSGALSAVDALSGAVPASGAMSGTPTSTPPAPGLAGAVPASANLGGAPSAADSLAGAVPPSSNVVGFPGAVDALTGAVPASASLSGTVSGTKTRSFARLIAFGLMGAAA